MKLGKLSPIVGLALLGLASESHAIPFFNLVEIAWNIDGSVSDSLLGDPVPGVVNDTAFDYATGLGTLSVSLSGIGAHNVLLFVDHDIDDVNLPQGNTFFNEFGDTGGVEPTGLTWEIDEPGYVFGDIFDHVLDSLPSGSLLDSANNVPDGLADDVSMALAWNFDLLLDEVAKINFIISTVQPDSGFFLEHVDPDSDASLFFFTSFNIVTATVPEPETLVLLSLGLIGLARLRRRRR